MASHADRPLLRKPPSFFTNLYFRSQALAYTWLTPPYFAYIKSRDAAFWAAQAPALVKTYPVRPSLSVRVHLPQGYDASSPSSQKYPLFYLIHGGGWVLGDASQDDEQAHLLAQAGYVVVSPNYRFGPSHRYPTPLHDCAAILQAALDDSTLPIDTRRVVVGGFSAGGNMAMALAQLPALRGRIHALLQSQGCMDFTGEVRGPRRTAGWGEPDGLQHMIPLAEWAYVPAGADLRDPLISPRFATRADVPQPVFFMTSSGETIQDEICGAARRLAGLETDGGAEQPDPEESFEAEGGRVVYHFVPHMPHGFEHFWVQPKAPEWKVKKEEMTKELWHKVLGWLDRVLVEE